MDTFPTTSVPSAGGAAVFPFENEGDPAPNGPLDQLVFRKWRELGIRPAKLCSDVVFVRRAYLDVIGTLPTAQEAREFIVDQAPDKRSTLIDRLLGREEYADYWALKWCDILRVKSEFPIDLWPNAVQAYHRWIRTCVKDNVPYDRFVREMLTASGSNFRVPQVNFYRAIQGRKPQAVAQAVALTFMGARADKWPGSRLSNMTTFFSEIGYKATQEWKEEIVLFDPAKATAKSAGSMGRAAVLPDGTPTRLTPGRDPREIFADWLIAPKNPWFARNIVNRIWYWLLGRGIIQEPDDIRPDNPPQNAALLQWLERQLVASHYDLRAIYRVILNSTTYQLSSIPRAASPAAEAAFACYPIRRLDAEVLIDALDGITGTTEKYESPIPEPFTFIPENQRSIALADGSITSSFLVMFGRPARDTGFESERNNRPSAAQRLHLLNSSHILRKIERSPNINGMLRARNAPRKIVESLYLTVLSRYPTDDELSAVASYLRSGPGAKRDAVIDLVWALINSSEFLYRH